MDDAFFTQLIANRGSVFLEHLPTGKMRLCLRVQGIEPRSTAELRRRFRCGCSSHQGRRWSVVSAQARDLIQQIERPIALLDTPAAKHFVTRLATLRLISPEAVDGGPRTKRARNTFDE